MISVVLKRHGLKKQQGATLLEVMIGLFVLAVGMLGFMGLLTSSLTMNQRSYTLSQAMFLAEEIADRARANREALTSYGIILSASPPSTASIGTKCNAANCTEAQLAAWDIAEWMETLQAALPGSDAQIVIDTSVVPNVMRIDIQYYLKQGQSGMAGGQVENYPMVTEI